MSKRVETKRLKWTRVNIKKASTKISHSQVPDPATTKRLPLALNPRTTAWGRDYCVIDCSQT